MANKYLKSKRADDDIKHITKYTVLNFGEQQADKYLDGLDETMELLAGNPDLGKVLTHPNKDTMVTQDNYHHYRYISHVIYYRKRKESIFVVRILHKSMLPLNHL